MSNAFNSRTFGRQLVVWTVAAIVGITIAMVAVGLLGLWVLVGIGGAVVGTIATGLLGTALFATDFDAILEARQNAQNSRDISS